MGSSVQEYRIRRMQEEEHNDLILYRRVASALYIFRCVRQSGIYQIEASSQLLQLIYNSFQLIRNSLQIFSFIFALVCFSIIARLVVRFSTALVCFSIIARLVVRFSIALIYLSTALVCLSTILVCLSTALALCACTSIVGLFYQGLHTPFCVLTALQ